MSSRLLIPTCYAASRFIPDTLPWCCQRKEVIRESSILRTAGDGIAGGDRELRGSGRGLGRASPTSPQTGCDCRGSSRNAECWNTERRPARADRGGPGLTAPTTAVAPARSAGRASCTERGSPSAFPSQGADSGHGIAGSDGGSEVGEDRPEAGAGPTAEARG